MKLNKLLLVSVAFMLGLSACQKAPKKDDSKPDSESQSESIPPEPAPVKSLFYLDEGESEGFPDEVVEEFLEYYELDFDILPIAEDQDWEYYVDIDDYATPRLSLYTEDDNSPNEGSPDSTGEAIEDDYKALLEEEGIEIYDSNYEDNGYEVYSDDNDLLFYFYSWEGYFAIIAFADEIQTEEVSQEILDYFFSQAAFMEDVEFPLPESEELWSYELDLDGSSSELEIETTDLNAPNNDNPGPNGEAIEDAYKEMLEDAGWTVDDSAYDSDGYYAFTDELPEITLFFYSWNDRFILDIDFYFEEFPVDIVNEFIDRMGGELEDEMPIPESEYPWSFSFELAGEESLLNLNTYDDGTPGDDSIEDVYYALLNGNDWELDDSAYDYFGYLATSGNVLLVFYSYNGYFSLSVMLADSFLK